MAASDEMIEKILNGKPEEIPKLYDQWAETYDKDNLELPQGYPHPGNIARIASEYISDKTLRVIDVCAGTGFGGQALQKQGFQNIDALDGASKMLEKAKAKGVYKNFFCEYITEEKLKTIEDNTYDVLVTSGSFVGNQLGTKQLHTIARMVKPGGSIFIAMREEFLVNCDNMEGLEDKMNALENEKFWKKVKWDIMPNYHDGKQGKVYIYQRL